MEEQAKILIAGRSNNTLEHQKLMEALGDHACHVKEIHEAVELCMIRMRKNLEADGNYPACLPRRVPK